MSNKETNHRLILAIDSIEHEHWIATIQEQLANHFEIVLLRPNQEETNQVLQQINIYKELAKQTTSDNKNLGIIISGTGLEASIVLNKLKGIRAALVSTYYLAAMTRLHNNANVMIIGADHTGKKAAQQFIQPFLTNDLEVGPGKSHALRVDKITQIEKNQHTN